MSIICVIFDDGLSKLTGIAFPVTGEYIVSSGKRGCYFGKVHFSGLTFIPTRGLCTEVRFYAFRNDYSRSSHDGTDEFSFDQFLLTFREELLQVATVATTIGIYESPRDYVKKKEGITELRV